MTDLTTLASVKAYIGMTGTTDDALIGQLIGAYSQAVCSMLNRVILSGPVEIWRDGRGGRTLSLPDYPVTDIVLLEIDGQAIPAQAGYGQAGYRFTDTKIILDGYRFTVGSGNVHVDFTAGYDEVPADIQQAVNELVALRYKERDRIGHRSKSLAGETVSFITAALPDSVKAVLAQYAQMVPA
jgi:uncharacterized phiE125 gp8 family phage protein